MFGIANSWAFLVAHPLVGFTVFLVVSAAIILVVSGGHLSASLGGMLRVALTILSTPFVFLRDALTILRTSGETEKDYVGSRVFTMFRLNRLQYLGIVLLCLLTLSSGLTATLLSLYPQAELAQERQLTEQITQIEEELVAAQQAAQSTAAPDFRQTLEQARVDASAAHQRQVQDNAEFAQGARHQHTIINQVRSTTDAQSLVSFKDNNLDNFMAGCPRNYSWPRGMTIDDCTQFRVFLIDVVDRRIAEIAAAEAVLAAENAWREADSAAQLANNRVADVQGRLNYTTQLRADVAPFTPERIGDRIKVAIGGFMATLLSVIILVWLGAALMDLFNWIILLMRSAEQEASEKLERMGAAGGDA